MAPPKISCYNSAHDRLAYTKKQFCSPLFLPLYLWCWQSSHTIKQAHKSCIYQIFSHRALTKFARQVHFLHSEENLSSKSFQVALAVICHF